jgi:hypothetical protein
VCGTAAVIITPGVCHTITALSGTAYCARLEDTRGLPLEALLLCTTACIGTVWGGVTLWARPGERVCGTGAAIVCGTGAVMVCGTLPLLKRSPTGCCNRVTTHRQHGVHAAETGQGRAGHVRMGMTIYS